MAPLALGFQVLTDPGATVHRHGLANDQTVLDQLPGGLRFGQGERLG